MDNQKEITYINNISVEDYNALRKSVNWINVTEKSCYCPKKFFLSLCSCLWRQTCRHGKDSQRRRLYIFHNRCYRTSGLSGLSHRNRTHTPWTRLYTKRRRSRRNCNGKPDGCIPSWKFLRKIWFSHKTIWKPWSRNVNVGFQRCHRKSYDFLKIHKYAIPIQTYSIPHCIGNQSLQVCSQVHLYQHPMFYTTHQD